MIYTINRWLQLRSFRLACGLGGKIIGIALWQYLYKLED